MAGTRHGRARLGSACCLRDPFGIGCSPPALLCSIAGTPQRFIGSVEDNTGLVGTPGRFVGGIVDTPRRFVCGPAGEDPDACENGLVGTPGRFVNGIVGTPQRFVTGIVTTPQRFVTGIVTTPQRFVGGLTGRSAQFRRHKKTNPEGGNPFSAFGPLRTKEGAEVRLHPAVRRFK